MRTRPPEPVQCWAELVRISMAAMMPATNKKMTDVMGIDQLRWENGKFAEHWGLFDDRTMMMQLGLMTPPGAPPTADAGMPKDQKKM